jgi:thioesterase domain-containing protein
MSAPSPIITLQPGSFKAPLFIIHPVGGTIFWYTSLSRYLDSHRPIYGIQDPGIDANDLLFETVEEMAAYYIKHIQKVQPQGPYLLAGASFGATVAIEISNQLLKSGETVNFIGLLDGWPIFSEKFLEKDFFEKLMLEQFKRFQSQFINHGINDIQFLLKLQTHRMEMLRYYKVPVINAKLTSFKADELWHTKELGLPSNCWEPYSTQPVDLHIVPGNHETMFWEPHVQVLAKEINQCLKKLETEGQDKQDNAFKLMTTPIRLGSVQKRTTRLNRVIQSVT